MHKAAMEMGKWAMEKAKACGFDKLSPQDWDDQKCSPFFALEKVL